MNRHLPVNGEIFVKHPKKASTKRIRSAGKVIGLASIMLLVLVGINGLVAGTQLTSQAQHGRTITDPVTPPVTPGIGKYLPFTQKYASNTVPIAHYYYPTPTLIPVRPNTPTTDLNTILNQLNQTNSAIVSNMYACINITQQAVNQVAQLRAQEQQMKTTMEQLREEERSLDPKDTDTPARRAELRAQRDQMNDQRNDVLNTIRDVRREHYTARNECNTSVYNQQRNKRNLENQLNDAYRNETNIRFP